MSDKFNALLDSKNTSELFKWLEELHTSPNLVIKLANEYKLSPQEIMEILIGELDCRTEQAVEDVAGLDNFYLNYFKTLAEIEHQEKVLAQQKKELYSHYYDSTPIDDTYNIAFPSIYSLEPENGKHTLIVLFFSHTEGVVLYSELADRHVGEWCLDLISCDDCDSWVVYKEEIEVGNLIIKSKS